MERTKISKILTVLFAVVLCFGPVGLSEPLGTAFTYQGRLIDANNSADGLYDFQFKLFDAVSDGNQLGLDGNIAEVDVIDGYFTAELDFGSVFDSNAAWLDIGVRPGELGDPNLYTSLSPRQLIAPMPYALYAKTAGSGGGGGADSDWIISGNDMYSGVSGNVGIGATTPTDKLDVAGHINSSESYKLDGTTVLANTGSGNFFVGQYAGGSIPTGSSNSAMGAYSLFSNIDGNNNSAVGYQALYDNTTGWANSAVGVTALPNNTTGFCNSAVGYEALYQNTTGYNNSAMGAYSLRFNTTGCLNSAMGFYALRNTTTGSYNSATGGFALYHDTNGYNNSAMGAYSLYSNTTGYNNSAMGYFALYANTIGNSNTAVGYEAGNDNSTGNGNVFLGNRAGYSETGSNKLYIANSAATPPLIYGDFSTGNVGLGTTSPAAKLQVAGQVKITGGSPAAGKVLTSDATGLATWQTPTVGGDSDWIISGSSMYSGVLDNVGIGTTHPTDKLDVVGNINSSGSYKLNGETVLATWSYNIFVGQGAGVNNTIGNSNTAVGLFALNKNTTGNDNSAVGVNALSNTTGNNNTAVGSAAGLSNITGSGNVFLGYGAGYNETGSNKLYIANSSFNPPLIYGDFSTGNVGIGTTSPDEKLTVNEGTIKATNSSTTGTGVHGEATGSFGVGVYAKGGLYGYAAELQGIVRICDRDSGSTVMLLGKGLDYAEGFDVSEEDGVSPGTVLVIDRENPGKLAVSRNGYDKKVAGIVAGAKGLTSGVRLGVEGFDCDVALAGRVYCNVDATGYGIEPGDMLTTSDKPGYAMKAADHTRASGAILGKAMEKLEKGKKAQILVLVTLQ